MKWRGIPNKLKNITCDDLESKAVKKISLTKEQIIFLNRYLSCIKSEEEESNVPTNSTTSPYYTTKIKNTALHTALRCGDTKAFKMLLDLGADPNGWDDLEKTPLQILMLNFIAPKWWIESRIKDLMNAGGDINAAGSKGQTALHLAARLRKKKIAKILLAAGADINARNDVGETPLIDAELSVYLRRSARTMLLRLRGTVEGMVEFLINAGADIHATNKFGNTALHRAAKIGNANIVKLLLAAGADPNARDNTAFTPLMFASTKGVVTELINAGADVNAAAYQGQTALHGAARFRRKKIAKILLAAGANPNVRDIFGSTLLGYACAMALAEKARTPRTLLRLCGTNEGIVECLINAGADIHATMGNGRTALHVAADFGNLIIDNGNNVKLLLAAGADRNARDDDGCTPLLITSAKGIVADLINAGADINATNSRGETALHLATRHKRTKIAKMLRAAGADPNAGADIRNEQQGSNSAADS